MYPLLVLTSRLLVCLCIFISIGLRVYMIMSNRIRDRKYGTAESREGEVLDGIRLGMHDLTELENPDFRYVL